jgi:hypothetical protein
MFNLADRIHLRGARGTVIGTDSRPTRVRVKAGKTEDRDVQWLTVKWDSDGSQTTVRADGCRYIRDTAVEDVSKRVKASLRYEEMDIPDEGESQTAYKLPTRFTGHTAEDLGF